MTDDFSEAREQKMMRLPSGGLVTLEMVSFGQARVVGLLSTNPRDYLDARWQPGNTVTIG